MVFVLLVDVCYTKHTMCLCCFCMCVYVSTWYCCSVFVFLVHVCLSTWYCYNVFVLLVHVCVGPHGRVSWTQCHL